MSQAAEAERPLARRELFGTAASGLIGLLTGCGTPGATTEVIETPDGKVIQWQRDDLLVLVSGLREQYRVGEEIRLEVILNNQTQQFGLFRLRTRLAGRAQQVVAEAPLASLQVRPFDAARVERVLLLGPTVSAGDYSLQFELPAWSLEGKTTGGGSFQAPVRVERS